MAQKEFVLIPHIVVNPSNVVFYNEFHSDHPRTRSNAIFIDVNLQVEEQTKFLRSTRKANGNVSDNAKRKMSKAIEYLVTTAQQKKVHEKLTGKIIQFKVAFITLTLPSKQEHPDTEIINRCLNSLLIECKKFYNVKNYVWRAEKQKNGNLHFHILFDAFVPWYQLRDRWNRIINKLGYVDRFQEKHGHTTPNSTDIHSTRRIKNIKAYLVKYMAKAPNQEQTEGNEPTEEIKQEGRIWSCNQELSRTKGLNLIVDTEIEQEMKRIFDSGKSRKYEGNYFTVYYFDYHLLLKVGSHVLFKYFSDYLFEQLQFSEQLKFTG